MPITERAEFWELLLALAGVVSLLSGAWAYSMKKKSDATLLEVKATSESNQAQLDQAKALSLSLNTVVGAWGDESRRNADTQARVADTLAKQTDVLTDLVKSVRDLAGGITDTRTGIKSLPDTLADATSKAVGKAVNGMTDTIEERFAKVEKWLADIDGKLDRLLEAKAAPAAVAAVIVAPDKPPTPTAPAESPSTEPKES